LTQHIQNRNNHS